MPVPALKKLADKSGKSLEKVEELWSKAKAQAAKQGRSEDYAYITGILKKMLGLDETYSPEDAALTAEIVGPEPAQKLLTESMPGDIRQALFQKYVNMELQLRRKITGKEMNWHYFLRNLREAVILLLNWASRPADVKESAVKDMGGII